MRARAAGFVLAVANDAFVYHAQSRSYSNAGRRGARRQGRSHARAEAQASSQGSIYGLRLTRDNRLLSAPALALQCCTSGAASSTRDGCASKANACSCCCRSPIRAEVAAWPSRKRTQCAQWVWMRASLTIKMVSDTLKSAPPRHRRARDCVAGKERVPRLLRDFDAVIATADGSVEWMSLGEGTPSPAVRAYYVQDFEPFFYLRRAPTRIGSRGIRIRAFPICCG